LVCTLAGLLADMNEVYVVLLTVHTDAGIAPSGKPSLLFEPLHSHY